MHTAGHGPNVGHGYIKYVLIDPDGSERAVTLPSLIARAQRVVAGALAGALTVDVAGAHWWVGSDALLAPERAQTALSSDRLSDPYHIPALIRAALTSFGHLNGSVSGVCVTGLPATWAGDLERARLLGQRVRDAHNGYSSIRVIAEPLGLIYSVLLDTHGHTIGDPRFADGSIAVIDIGHHTVDIAVVTRLRPIDSSLDTWQMGTARPLSELRAALSSWSERELSLYETDLAVRAQALKLSGVPTPLPAHWDRPMREHASALVTRLVERWGRGTQFDAILIGGGGAELAPLVEAIRARFPHAIGVDQPQTAIGRGYARLARRFASQMR